MVEVLEINGNNHDINGNLIDNGNCYPGIAVDGETQRQAMLI